MHRAQRARVLSCVQAFCDLRGRVLVGARCFGVCRGGRRWWAHAIIRRDLADIVHREHGVRECLGVCGLLHLSGRGVRCSGVCRGGRRSPRASVRRDLEDVGRAAVMRFRPGSRWFSYIDESLLLR